MKGRLIAIGDIHGCHAEFAELVDRLAPGPDDRLILLGDLINRGPDSRKVIALARQHRTLSLLGNHEWRLLKIRRLGDGKALKDGDRETIETLAPDDWAYLEEMPLMFEEPSLDLAFVHGGFLPDQPWRQQPADVVTRIQVIDKKGRPAKRTDEPNASVWADLWTGPPYVVYGHTPRTEVYEKKWSVCIDTGCVYGGYLTAIEFPGRQLVQVKARRRYWPR